MKRFAVLLALFVCVFESEVQAEEAKREWVERVREICEKPLPRERRVMPVFPLVKAGSENGEIGWGRGLIALQSMWLTSFAPNRVLDTWDFRVDKLFRDQQLIGNGRLVTDKKIEAVCAVFDTENYTTGTLEVEGDSYVAEVTFNRQNDTEHKTYSGKRTDLHKLPCRIARDILDLLQIPLTEEQNRNIETPPLGSADFFDEVAGYLPAYYYFSHDYRPFLYTVMSRDRRLWTVFMFLESYARNRATTALKVWEQYSGGDSCGAFDYMEANLAWRAAKREGGEYIDRAGRTLALLLEKDPYNPYVVTDLARTLGRAGEGELAETVAERLFLVYKDSFLAHLHHGILMKDYAWDARGGGWASTVTEEGWKLFGERLRRAKLDLEKALEMEPTCWDASRELIVVATGMSLPREYAEARLQEAVAHCPTDYMARDNMAWSLQPRWGGSIEELLEFGRRCARTELYRAGIPGILVEAHFRVCADLSRTNEADLWNEYFSKDEVWNEVGPVLQRLAEENPQDYRDMTYYLAIAFYRGNKQLARQLLAHMDNDVEALAEYDREVMRPDGSLYKRIKQWVNEAEAPGPKEAGE